MKDLKDREIRMDKRDIYLGGSVCPNRPANALNLNDLSRNCIYYLAIPSLKSPFASQSSGIAALYVVNFDDVNVDVVMTNPNIEGEISIEQINSLSHSGFEDSQDPVVRSRFLRDMGIIPNNYNSHLVFKTFKDAQNYVTTYRELH